MRSIVRRLVTAGAHEPYDIEVFPAVRARIYPHSNVCEKRVFAAPQLYDWAERRALSEAMARSDAAPFIFVDLGANVGVYTLWMLSEARRLSRPLKALAIEPDPETFGRLSTNLSLSAADEAIALQCAAGAEQGRGHIVGHADNRGQHRIELGGTATGEIAVLPLHVMKAPAALWPGWMIVEVGKQAEAPVIDLCRQHGYRLMERTKLNAILHHPGAGDRAS